MEVAMATIVHHHHEGISIPSVVLWTIGLGIAVVALLVISVSMLNRTEVASLPALTEMPLIPPPLPFMPLM